jgi:hypothetical protein
MSSSFVANRLTAWLLYNEASSWSVRPSTLLDLQDPYTAFCFDQAINYWGKTIEGELEKVEGKNAKDTELRRKSILEKYLYPDGDGSSKHQFSDPALMFM